MLGWYLIGALFALSLGACQGQLRGLTVASLADLDQVDAKILTTFEDQRDAYIRAKADGSEDPTMVAFDSAAESADTAPVSGSFGGMLEILLQILMGGALGTGVATAASRARRGLTLLTGAEKPATPTNVRKPRARAKAKAK